MIVLRLSAACLTTTFIITQFTSALRRIIDSENEPLRRQLLPRLLDGRHFTTVGISHLTTSRRHLAKPVLTAEEKAGGFVLDGYSPWVTGAAQARPSLRAHWHWWASSPASPRRRGRRAGWRDDQQ